MNNINILIVEDEESMARFVELELLHEGYTVKKAADGRTALDMALGEDFDLILLDVMIPELNGLEVLRRLQNEKQTPVILLTARDSVIDKVAGLDAGAIDYITKPFAIEELLARIRVAIKHKIRKSADITGEEAGALPGVSGTGGFAAGGSGIGESGIGRSGAGGVGIGGPGTGGVGIGGSGIGGSAGPEGRQEEGVLVHGELVLDDKKHLVTYAGQEITLTNREFQMLKILLENRDIVLSRDTLLDRVCGYDYMGETNIVDVYIRHLRAKIDETFDIKLIHTIRGAGYVIK